MCSQTKRIILFSNQLDFSGAPVALLQLAKFLRSANFDVSIYSIEPDAGLGASFLDVGVIILDYAPDLDDYHFVIFNTVVSTRFLPNKPIKGRAILWIHESPYLGGLVWSKAVCLERLEYVDCLWFPSRACLREWRSFLELELLDTLCLPSPISTDRVESFTVDLDDSVIRFCVVDSRDKYRRVHKIEQALSHVSYPVHVDFIACSEPHELMPLAINASVRYQPRLSQEEVLLTLAQSHIYITATLLATQNRTMCEAMWLGKHIAVTSIPAHNEFVRSVEYPRYTKLDCFAPINLDKIIKHYQLLKRQSRAPNLSILSMQSFSDTLNSFFFGNTNG